MHHNFWGSPVPVSVLQLVFPRVELHLFYNTIVFIPMVIGMYYHMFPPAGERKRNAPAHGVRVRRRPTLINRMVARRALRGIMLVVLGGAVVR